MSKFFGDESPVNDEPEAPPVVSTPLRHDNEAVEQYLEIQAKQRKNHPLGKLFDEFDAITIGPHA